MSSCGERPRLAGNPPAAGDPDIRLYAGAPPRWSSRHAVGAPCGIDRKMREADPRKPETLRTLASEVIRRVEARCEALAAGRAS